AEHVVLQRRTACRPAAVGGGTPGRRLHRGGQRTRRRDRAVRGAALPILRQLLRVRQLLRCLSGQRGPQADRHYRGGSGGTCLCHRLRLLQGLWALRQRMPEWGDRDAARADLTSCCPTAACWCYSNGRSIRPAMSSVRKLRLCRTATTPSSSPTASTSPVTSERSGSSPARLTTPSRTSTASCAGSSSSCTGMISCAISRWMSASS